MVPTRIVMSRPMLASPQALLYVRLRKYNASTVSRKRDIVHMEESKAAAPAAAAVSAGADSSSQSDYLRLLGERVREMRARRGMTRKILARDSGVSERYLAQLESGQGNISILLLRQIAQALDTPLQALDRKSTRLNSSHRCISYAVS